MRNRPYIKKGQNISCPKCKKLFATAGKDIMSGDKIANCDFQFRQDNIVNGSQLRCDCGMVIFMFLFKEYWV